MDHNANSSTVLNLSAIPCFFSGLNAGNSCWNLGSHGHRHWRDITLLNTHPQKKKKKKCVQQRHLGSGLELVPNGISTCQVLRGRLEEWTVEGHIVQVVPWDFKALSNNFPFTKGSLLHFHKGIPDNRETLVDNIVILYTLLIFIQLLSCYYLKGALVFSWNSTKSTYLIFWCILGGRGGWN